MYIHTTGAKADETGLCKGHVAMAGLELKVAFTVVTTNYFPVKMLALQFMLAMSECKIIVKQHGRCS